ncbi:MAG: hypothetical protein IIX16_02720 [Clostridia bacterium]|nr:hypothetical protein [Clostridia bacterium]
MSGVNHEYLKDHKLFRVRNKRIIALFPVIAFIVAIAVFWCLKLVGITITSDALCELDEHTHISSCYSGDELVCLKPEHTHTAECFPDKTVDTETTADWLKTLEHITITNNLSENLVAVATSQVGYSESDRNYEYNAFAEKNNYTRYGEWYGSPYGEWNTMFVSFCIDHANINNSDLLTSASAESMRQAWDKKYVYYSAESYDGERGDVVFFDTDANGKADRTGIAIYRSDNLLMVIEGDVDGEVKKVNYTKTDDVLGYGKTSKLYVAEHITSVDKGESEIGTVRPILEGKLKYYIPNSVTPTTYNLRRSAPQSVYDSEPLIMMAAANQDIIYISHLEDEVVDAVFKDLNGNVLGSGSTVHIGQSYVVSLEFSEINTSSPWIQFEHNEEGYLTYHIPSNLHCDEFDSWHKISAKTEAGTVEDVGEYYVDANGLLKVKFYEDANGVNFVDKYGNVDFTIDFSAMVDATQSGESTEIKFNDDIKISLDIDGEAGINVTKTHGEYNNDDNTLEYTIKVEATHGLVKDLVIDDQIWENHYTLRDTIVVTDLDGNPIVPQPTVSDHPKHNQGTEEGFRLTGFPDFSAGEGFLIKYKSTPYENLLSNDFVNMWNGIDANGKNPNGGNVYKWAEDWIKVEFNKIEKDGKMVVLTDAQGNKIPVIEWGVGIRKTAENLQGTVIIDTLGEGLAYYTDQPITIKRYDEWGNRLPDTYLSWDQVTVTNTDGVISMKFALPSGYAFDLIYYTTFPPLDEGETDTHKNRVEAIINTRPEGTEGSADVIGFVPHVEKHASGNDGEYVNFEIKADVSGAIKEWGHFFLTDLAAFWGYNNAEGCLYVQNLPENLVITATTESGQVVTFTPYVEDGPTENTYILVAPADGNQHHSFNILFNTADTNPDTMFESSKWLLNEDATLKVTYRLPFDAKTGTEWVGELTGDKTLEDVLLEGYKMSNEVYMNFTQAIQGVAGSQYEYSPMITKKGQVNDNGTIDYNVVFNNSVPGSGGHSGYIHNQTTNVVFHDDFDEKLEYVNGSLVVTCYSPYNTSTWLAKYRYNGTVSGNSFDIRAEDFQLLEYNTESGWDGLAYNKNLKAYYEYVNAGGKYVFSYQLKVKDEHLATTDHSKYQLDNVVELTWGNDNTSGTAHESVEFETGLLDKQVVQEDSKLSFGIHVNRGALDILEGADTLTIEDVMTENLSVYWNSIKLKYEDAQGNWVDFDSEQSGYEYTITYDPASNKLTFVVPDELHIIIDYQTLITESGMVSVSNSIVVDGKAEVSDIVDAIFRVNDYSGGASGSNQEITLIKQDGITNHPLPGATFILYGPVGEQNPVLPQGISPTLITEDGNTLKYIGTYTTGEDGTCNIETQFLTPGGPYAFVELVAPEGYELLDKPVYFYFYDTDDDGFIQSVTTLIAIENFSGSFLIPETGGMVFFTATIGFAITAVPILYSLIRRKRERRLKNLLG